MQPFFRSWFLRQSVFLFVNGYPLLFPLLPFFPLSCKTEWRIRMVCGVFWWWVILSSVAQAETISTSSLVQQWIRLFAPYFMSRCPVFGFRCLGKENAFESPPLLCWDFLEYQHPLISRCCHRPWAVAVVFSLKRWTREKEKFCLILLAKIVVFKHCIHDSKIVNSLHSPFVLFN